MAWWPRCTPSKLPMVGSAQGRCQSGLPVTAGRFSVPGTARLKKPRSIGCALHRQDTGCSSAAIGWRGLCHCAAMASELCRPSLQRWRCVAHGQSGGWGWAAGDDGADLGCATPAARPSACFTGAQGLWVRAAPAARLLGATLLQLLRENAFCPPDDVSAKRCQRSAFVRSSAAVCGPRSRSSPSGAAQLGWECPARARCCAPSA